MTATDRAPEVIQPNLNVGDLLLNASVAAQQWSSERASLDTPAPGKSSLPKLDLVDRAQTARAELGVDKAPDHNSMSLANFPPELTVDNFGDAAKSLLAKINPTSPDHIVDKKDLQTAIQYGKYTGADAQALVAIYDNIDDLAQTRSTSHNHKDRVVSSDILDKFEARAKARETQITQGDLMNAWASTNLERFTNSVGRVTKDSISKALEDPKLLPDDRRGLQMIQQHYGEISSWYDVLGISKGKIAKYDKNLHHDKLGTTIANLKDDFNMAAKNAQAPGDNYSLYATRDPLKSINPDAIHQGVNQDCYFESVVACMTKTNPTLLHDCIKDHGDGTFTVTFPAAKDRPVKVTLPSQAENALFNSASSDGQWACVLEKAFGVYKRTGNEEELPQEVIGKGGQPADVMQLFTGKAAHRIEIGKDNQAAVVAQLKDNFAGHTPKKMLVADTTPSDQWDKALDPELTPDGYLAKHAYSVMGFKSDTKGGGSVEIRNPWGDKTRVAGSTFTISISKFLKNFTGLTIQG